MSKFNDQDSVRFVKGRYPLSGTRDHKAKRFISVRTFLFLAAGVIEVFVWAIPVLPQNKVQNLSNTTNAQIEKQKVRTVELELSDIVQLVIQNNRNLENNFLNRIVERQELVEANSKFVPTITPSFSASANDSISSSSSLNLPEAQNSSETNSTPSIPSSDTSTSENIFVPSFGSNNDIEDDNFNSSLQIGANLLTPLGTNITLSTDPLDNFNVFGLEIRQPLMRGAGTKVNRASVKSARLTDTRRILELKQSLIDEITEAIKAYRTLLQAQEEVRIRQNSLNSRQQDLKVQTALVETGRRARSDLVQLEASVARAEEQLLNAFNNLSQANSDLLRIIDTDEDLEISVPQKSIEALTDENLPRPVNLSYENLLQTAYAKRPDYLQANLDIKINQFNLIEARDNRRWELDAVGEIRLGDNSQAFGILELTRTFEDQSLQTAFQRVRVDLLQAQNSLEDTRETVEIEVRDRVTDVNSNFVKIEKARQAKELAQERLSIVRELYRRGRGGINIFEVTSQQDAVVEAQNTELNAVIDYLNARTDLEQSFGVTLNSWQEFINKRKINY